MRTLIKCSAPKHYTFPGQGLKKLLVYFKSKWQHSLLNESAEGMKMTEKWVHDQSPRKYGTGPGLNSPPIIISYMSHSDFRFGPPMLIEAKMRLDLPPPPQQEHPPPTHTHTHIHITTTTTTLGHHTDIQGDEIIIHGKPRWSPHSLKSIYNQPVRM